LVYGLEGEKAPDDVVARAPKRKSSRKLKMQASSKNRLLKFLSSFMWFFSRLELTLHLCMGVPWIFRDILAVLVMAVVLIVHSVCLAVIAGVSAARQCYRRLACPAVAQGKLCPKSSTDVGAVGTAPPLAAAPASAESRVPEVVASSGEHSEAEQQSEEDAASVCRRQRLALRTCRLSRKQSWSASQPFLAPRSKSCVVSAPSRALRKRRTVTWKLA